MASKTRRQQEEEEAGPASLQVTFVRPLPPSSVVNVVVSEVSEPCVRVRLGLSHSSVQPIPASPPLSFPLGLRFGYEEELGGKRRNDSRERTRRQMRGPASRIAETRLDNSSDCDARPPRKR